MEPEKVSPNNRRVISTRLSRVEIIWAVLGALLFFGVVCYAVMSLGKSSAQTSITGKIVEKKFVPRPETQLTIGAGGVQRSDKAGQYYLSIRADGTQEVYKVLLSEKDYNRVEVGDSYQIPQASLVSENH
jgi:hypothetical protein